MTKTRTPKIDNHSQGTHQHDQHVEDKRVNDALLEQQIVEIAPEVVLPRSVVATSYKRKYAERALTAKNVKGVSKKARARSCGDWLSVTLAKLCLVQEPCVDEDTGETLKRDAISIERFTAILDANGVDHSRWTNRSKGWQGRFRMTGRLALQRVVAEGGELEIPAELASERGFDLTVPAPASWVKAHTH